MKMFCYQCQETAKGLACEIAGVCGKNAEVAKTQDVLLYVLRGIAVAVQEASIDARDIPHVNVETVRSLFMTITNANFDQEILEKQIYLMQELRDKLVEEYGVVNTYDSLSLAVNNREEIQELANSVGVLRTTNEDVRSLRELNTYGLKGLAAYLEHAYNLGYEDYSIYNYVYELLAVVSDEELSVDELVAQTLKTGEYGVEAMALLDRANSSTYGNPEITNVNIGTRNNPAILISGHDLRDMEMLLEQTSGTGVDVYTHGEMLPANYYPAFKKYDHFVGNYGNSWWQQTQEFKSFNGPILFTTNCIVPPRNDEVRDRIFTTGSAGYPGCIHIEADADGVKDFSAVIEMAKTLAAPAEIEHGEITGGFAHNQVISLASEIIDAVEKEEITKFVVMAGCDGRQKGRSYYTEFAEALPETAVILTAGCAKYRYNKLDLGTIRGLPRVLDAGQCNDSYSLVRIAMALGEAFGLEDLNNLPIIYNIAWYEQKAVIVLLALLHLGIKNIHLGPTLPAFLSPNVATVLVEQFAIAGIGSVEDDIELFFGE
ncbi:MAG: hydroxylamine reductase [Epulopiscium sp.]|nr:hydroxylamine reductase [Candidatus Epulonipiscium sp.]